MKRFWAQASVIAEESRFKVVLDGRPVKLPSGEALSVPFAGLAEAIAAEWHAAADEFALDDLFLTRLAATAQGPVREMRENIIAQLKAYGLNDLICYRASGPPGLVNAESRAWDPWLIWAQHNLGLFLSVGSGVMPVSQAAASGEQFGQILSDMTDYQLAGLGVIVPALGSLILGLVVESGALAPELACDCAAVDELWQEAGWGIDLEAAARRKSVLRDVIASARFIGYSRS